MSRVDAFQFAIYGLHHAPHLTCHQVQMILCWTMSDFCGIYANFIMDLVLHPALVSRHAIHNIMHHDEPHFSNYDSIKCHINVCWNEFSFQWMLGSNGWCVVLRNIPFGAQQALAVVLADGVQLAHSLRTAPGPHVIFTPNNTALSHQRVELTLDATHDAVARAPVRLRGAAPSTVNGTLGTVEV